MSNIPVANTAAILNRPFRINDVVRDSMHGEQWVRDNADYVLSHLPDIIFVADSAGDTRYVSPQFTDFTGVPPSEALNLRWTSYVHDDDVPETTRLWSAASRERSTFAHDFRLVDRANGSRWVRSRATPIFDRDGAIEAWFGVCADIQDLKDAQAALHENLDHQRAAERQAQEVQADLAQAARISVVGQFASLLAHELNQPLTAAAAYASSALRKLKIAGKDRSEAYDTMAKAELQVQRAGQIVHTLRKFIARGEAERTLQDFGRIIDEARGVALIGVQEAQVDVTIDLPPEPIPVIANKVQIQQVLVNLVRNAIQAMASAVVRELVLKLHCEDGRAIVCVSDTGSGVPAELNALLFMPFVSGKHDGMGVGLAISKAIVAAHGGRIWAEEREHGGTVFKFDLPLARVLKHDSG